MTHFGILLQFGEWSTCSEGDLPPFPWPNSTTSGYSYHQRWFSNFDGRYHCWLDSHRYGVASIDDDNTCGNDGCLREDTILHRTNIKWWLHSPCYWNVWVFSFSFWFIFYHLCIDHYRASLAAFFNPVDAYFSLLTMYVYSPVTCTSHSNFSTGCYAWSGFFIFSTHHS